KSPPVTAGGLKRSTRGCLAAPFQLQGTGGSAVAARELHRYTCRRAGEAAPCFNQPTIQTTSARRLSHRIMMAINQRKAHLVAIAYARAIHGFHASIVS
ncbi:hypothetical protein ABTE14_19055, partial [Acinetobacter baumannii]